jgi:hypothetical protein
MSIKQKKTNTERKEKLYVCCGSGGRGFERSPPPSPPRDATRQRGERRRKERENDSNKQG